LRNALDDSAHAGYSPELPPVEGLLSVAELLELSLLDDELSELVEVDLPESVDELDEDDESDEDEFDEAPVEVFAVVLSLRA
jgi:hypothetical protein